MGERTGGWYGKRVSSVIVCGDRRRLGAMDSSDGEGEDDSGTCSFAGPSDPGHRRAQFQGGSAVRHWAGNVDKLGWPGGYGRRGSAVVRR
jgi:hypothetical protein